MPTPDADPRSRERLAERLLDYRAQLRNAASSNPFLDLQEGERLVGVMLGLLDRWEDFTPEQQTAIHQTLDYLVESDDEEHDLRSPIGFVDDAERVDRLVAVLAGSD